ncbi:MAG: hypothetical protein ACTSQJ_19630 [Promethearchaeota archaeon]
MKKAKKTTDQKLIELGVTIIILAFLFLFIQYITGDPLGFALTLLIILIINIPLGIILLVIGIILKVKK